MKVIYCLRKDPIEFLKDKPTAHKTSKIKTKFSKPKFLCRKEFDSISNIEYLSFDNAPVYSTLFDSHMDKQLFESSFQFLNHKTLFDEYRTFNNEMAERINKIAKEDDIVIVNDSSLLLLPSLVKVKVAIRNLKFERCFIEKTPFYSEIIQSICQAQKFFDSEQSLNSFNEFLSYSYEFRDFENGGCWFIKPYVDKFIILQTLTKMKDILQCSTNKLTCTSKVCCSSELSNCSISEKKLNPDLCNLQRYLKSFEFPKNETIILTTGNLLHLEPFIKENPDIHVRYLRLGIEIDDEFPRMMQYLKKMYHSRITVADPTNYSHIVIEMFNCDMFIGESYKELALFFGKAVIEDSFDALQLKTDIIQSLKMKCKKIKVIGDEEYLTEFLKINGYDLKIPEDQHQNDCIEKTIKELKSLMKPDTTEYFEKKDESGTKEYCKEEESQINSYEPILIGSNSYFDIKHSRQAKELNLIDLNKVKEYWKDSNKTILLDYDGTLAPIVDEPAEAYPSIKLLRTLEKLSKSARIVICSGRNRKNLDDWIPNELEVFGEHGAFHRKEGKWTKLCKSSDKKQSAREIMEYYVKRIPGSFIEEKEAGIVLHYRKADSFFDVSKVYSLLRRVAGENIVLVKKGIEYRTGNKETVSHTVNPAICAGDDAVDEDMYKSCKGISIKVGKGRSYADGYIEDVNGLIEFLDKLSE